MIILSACKIHLLMYIILYYSNIHVCMLLNNILFICDVIWFDSPVSLAVTCIVVLDKKPPAKLNF